MFVKLIIIIKIPYQNFIAFLNLFMEFIAIDNFQQEHSMQAKVMKRKFAIKNYMQQIKEIEKKQRGQHGQTRITQGTYSFTGYFRI